MWVFLITVIKSNSRYYFIYFQGFITMVQFREILAEVDPNLSEGDLDGIIAEIDEDGSGTMDFDEFCEMMMTSPDDE